MNWWPLLIWGPLAFVVGGLLARWWFLRGVGPPGGVVHVERVDDNWVLYRWRGRWGVRRSSLKRVPRIPFVGLVDRHGLTHGVVTRDPDAWRRNMRP